MKFHLMLLAATLALVPNAFTQNDLEQRVEILEVEVTNIKDNVEDVEMDVTSLETDVSQNTGQLFEVVNDLDETDDLNDLQEGRIGVLEVENSALKAELDDLKLLVNSLTVAVNDNVVDIQALNETVGNLDIDNSTNERLNVLEGGFTQLESDVTILEGGFTQLESDVTILESGFTQLESDVTTLEGGFTQLESDVTILEGGFTQLESDVTNLEGGFTQLEADVTGLGDDVTDVELTVHALDTSTDQRLEALEENNADYSDCVFLATISVKDFTPSDPILWDTAILNPGGHYSTTLGVYTVPVDGIYQFVMHYRASDDTTSFAYIEVDNVKVANLCNCDADHSTPTANLDLTLSLTSGQQVWISPSGMEGLFGTDNEGVIQSWFSGHLIYPL